MKTRYETPPSQPPCIPAGIPRRAASAGDPSPILPGGPTSATIAAQLTAPRVTRQRSPLRTPTKRTALGTET